MIKLNFSGNWKLDLQNKVLSYTSDQRKKNAVYLEDEIHYVVFVLDEYHQEIVRISGNYQIDESEKCLLTSFEKEGETTDTSVSVDLILPFFFCCNSWIIATLNQTGNVSKEKAAGRYR